MLNIEITSRAKMIRIIIGESRIIDHLVCNVANMVDLWSTNFWYLFVQRDKSFMIYYPKLTGASLQIHILELVVLEFDLYDGFDDDLEDVVKRYASCSK